MLKDIHSLVVYHITPSENVQSILEVGVSTRYSHCKNNTVWVVSRQRIEWAIIHASNRHSVSVDNLAVCSLLVDGRHLTRLGRPGIYFASITLPIETAIPAMFFMEELGQGDRFDE